MPTSQGVFFSDDNQGSKAALITSIIRGTYTPSVSGYPKFTDQSSIGRNDNFFTLNGNSIPTGSIRFQGSGTTLPANYGFTNLTISYVTSGYAAPVLTDTGKILRRNRLRFTVNELLVGQYHYLIFSLSKAVLADGWLRGMNIISSDYYAVELGFYGSSVEQYRPQFVGSTAAGVFNEATSGNVAEFTLLPNTYYVLKMATLDGDIPFDSGQSELSWEINGIVPNELFGDAISIPAFGDPIASTNTNYIWFGDCAEPNSTGATHDNGGVTYHSFHTCPTPLSSQTIKSLLQYPDQAFLF